MILSYTFKDFVVEYYRFYFDKKYDDYILEQKDTFLRNYPLMDLDKLTLFDYCRNKRANEKKPSFIRSIEYLTNGLISSKTGKIEYRIFYEKPDGFHIYENYKDIFIGNTVEEKFEDFKKRMIQFINCFDPNNYDHNKFLPSNMNVFKAKLIFLYKFDLGLYGFSSKYKAQKFASALGIYCDKNDDTLDLLIRIYRYINEIQLPKKYEQLTVSRMMWQYYEKFVDFSNALEQEEKEEQLFGKERVTEIEKYELKKVHRSSKNIKIALGRAKNKCEYDSSHYCFPKRNNKSNYLECHHLIPYNIKTVKLFPGCDLDNPANIVCLCCNCHSVVHFGHKSIAKPIISKLYDLRESELKKNKIYISKNDLYALYGL